MSKVIQLRQDRSLIKSNFDGYKLSLDPVPLIRHELTAAPHKAEATGDQYSLLHAELFSMQNLLNVDPWERSTSYFVNRLGEVVRSAYDENTGRPEAMQVVFRIAGDVDANRRRSKGDYNYSMRFISEKFCVVCDGINRLQLLDTGDRIKSTEWKSVAIAEIGDVGKERNYTLYDCRLDTINEQKHISCALGRVQRIDNESRNSIHLLQLHWAKWSHEASSGLWNFSIIDTLEGKGSLYYCAFEPRAESLIICSNKEFKFRSQTKDSTLEEKPSADEKPPQLHDGSIEVKGFSWTQSDDDVVIKFDSRPEMSKTDYSVKCTAHRLTVKCVDQLLLDQEFYDSVDPDLTTWTIENNYLQVTLIKAAVSLRWPSLLKDCVGPKESTDGGVQSCQPMEQQPIANLEAPIEDCDFPIGTMEDDIKIVRFNIGSKSATHSVFLGSTPPLFATILRPGFPAAIATRQDVDASLWLQQYNPSKSDEWTLRHEGNLHAFGYIQASKQQRKFIDCSPDLNYALICESYRHLFLYRSNYDTADGLRNRSGPQVTLGKQHLITLEDAGEVLGIATSPNVVTLLTEKCILYLQIN